MSSSVGSIDLGAMLQNFGLLKSNPMDAHTPHTHTNKPNDMTALLPGCAPSRSNTTDIGLDATQNKDLYHVLGQLSNFNANNNKQSLFKNVNTGNLSHTPNSNINSMISQLTIPQNRSTHLTTRNQSQTQSHAQHPLHNLNPSSQQTHANQTSLFPMHNNTQLQMDRRTHQQQPPNQSQNSSNNNPYFKNVANFGMNLNITSTSQQIPLIDIHKSDAISTTHDQPGSAAKPLLLLSDKDDQKEVTKQNKKKKKKKATEQVEMKQEESIAIEKSTNCSTNNDLLCDDDQSSLSSSSSNVEQFLDSLKNDNSKKRKNDNKTKEPPSKKRRLNTEDCDDGDLSDEFEYDLLREVDEKTIECYSKELEEIRADTLRSFGLSCIKREPFIFRKSIDLDAMYPHRVYNKLLKYEECTADLTASQLLGLYAENMATMRMYKAYINLPSVVPITLPVIDGKCVSLRMLQRPFVIENWWDLHCKFPSGCSYLDLLVNIGGSTEIRVMDNITNCAISEDMKLYQYLYLLSGTKPEEREYSMNLISLEISGSILDRYIVRPRFIQNMDWISPKRHCWFKSNKFRKYFFSTTNNLRGIVDNVENKNLFYIEDGIKTMGGEEEEEEVDELEALKHSILSSKVTHSGFPEIQKYVLICSANSFTEWHTDFNGSCVWYYVVRGIKYFYIMTPTTPGILEEYRKWREQSEIRWFPEYAKCSAQLVIVAANELLVLPSGTIHCVYTPVDCVAFSGNWLCDDNIQKQLRIEHLHHEIHSPAHVPCCHYFRDLNALRVCEFYYEMKKNHKLKAKKDKQNAMDLCIQMLFWIKEEEEQQKKKTNDERLCKFDLIDIDKLKPKVVQTLAMLGCKTTLNIGNQMKRFVAKYPHYRAPKNALEGEEEEEESDSSSSSIISTNDDEESDYDIVEDDTQYDADTSEEDEQMIARKKTLRSATSTAANKKRIKKKKKKKKTTKKKKKKKSDKIECFKCAEQSPRRHMILFLCCDTYYHLRCAGYTTTRTQRAIQQHIDNGTINKNCPVCVKKGRK
eukprot:111427_1